MMETAQRPIVWILAAACVGLVCGCEDNNQDEAGAKALWERVQPIYTTWQSPSAFKALRPSETLHKSKVRVFFNPEMEALHVDFANCTAPGEKITNAQNATAWPLNSVVVKEGHDDSGLAIIAIMEKQAEGWFYAEYSASGEVLFSGPDPELCVSCHTKAMHDFTFSAHLSVQCP